jgi:hypothetical protein
MMRNYLGALISQHLPTSWSVPDVARGYNNGGFEAVFKSTKSSVVELFNLGKDLLGFYMQGTPPSRHLPVKTPQPNYSSNADKDSVECDLATNVTSGTERREARTSRTSLMQESITEV